MTDLKTITDTKTLLDIYTNALLRSEREHVAIERGLENEDRGLEGERGPDDDRRSIATIREMEEIMAEVRRKLEEKDDRRKIED